MCKPYYDALGITWNKTQMAPIMEDDQRFPQLVGGERGSKALWVETPVPTPTGWRTMGDLVVGDTVFDDTGSPCTVTGALPILHGRPVYRVRFMDGEEVVADAGHLWAVQDEKQRKNSCRKKVGGREVRVEPAELVTGRKHSILTTSEMAEQVMVEATESRIGFCRYSVLATLPVEYPEACLAIHPYVLGLWLGDGTSSSSSITKPDEHVFERVRSFGYETRKVPSAKYATTVLGLRPRLREVGVLHNKHIPPRYLQASVAQRKELLWGLMDSDGHIDDRGQCRFSNTNHALIEGFVELCYSLGLKATVSESRAMLDGKDCGPAWSVFFMAPFPAATLPRKAERQQLGPANHARHRYISSIEPVASVPVRCIEVDSPSRLFLAGRTFVPTHNSFTASNGFALPHTMMLPTVRHERFYDQLGRLRFNPRDTSSKPRNPDGVFFGPHYAEPKVEFEYLENSLRKLGEIPPNWRHLSKPQDGPWRMTTKSGVVVSTWSMEDPTTIRAVDLEWAVICECGMCPFDGILRVQGRVGAKRGWICYCGTLENSQQWYRDWAVMGLRENVYGVKTYSLPSWGNEHEFPGGRNDPEIKRWEAIYDDDLFAMRVAGEPRPPRYRVLKELTEKHIQVRDLTVPPLDEAIYEIAIDPGYASAYAVLFIARWQETRDPNPEWGEEEPVKEWQFHVCDEIYEQGKISDDIIDMVQASELWPLLARSHSGVFDIAAQGHRDGGNSALEIWQKRLPKFSWNMRLWKEDRLIERIRSSAKIGQITISPRCRGLIAEAGLGEPVFDEMHPWKYLTDRDGRVVSEKPVDKWNHSAKALGYYLLHHLGQVESKRKPTSFNRLAAVKPARTIFAPTPR